MAAAVRAELRLRGGPTERLSVGVAEGDLAALRGGLRELSAGVSRLLSELVEREKARGACATAEEEQEEEEDEDDQEEEGEPHLPAKRHRS